MIMQRQPDGSYEQIGFIKFKDGENIDTIVDAKGDVYFTQGFTREISGAPPLILDAIGKNALDYKIYGNSVQDGTPTPENPIEVQSVGDKTKNLFNKNDATVKGVIDVDGGISQISVEWFTTENFIKCSGSISLQAKNGLGRDAYISCYDSNKVLLGCVKQSSSNATTNTIQLIEGTEYIKTCCRENNLDSYQIELGSEATAYEPYGYKIPVVVTGKNLFDVANTQWTNNSYLSETGELVSNNTWNVTDYIPVRGMVFTINNQIGNVPCICLYDANKNLIASQSYAGHKVTTVTANELAHYCRFSLYARGDVSSDTVQLELGTESTDYEPYHEPITTNIYLDEPLKTGDILKYPENVLVHADGTAETLALPEIPTFDGTTVISADTEIQPSNMEITYKGKKKTEV